MQLGITVASRLAVGGGRHVEVHALDCVLASLHGSSGTSDRRLGKGYIHCQKALPRQQHVVSQFWSALDLSQTHLVADHGQAPNCADTPGQQISVKVNVLTHEFVQAVSDSVSFRSVNKDQPPSLLLLHLGRGATRTTLSSLPALGTRSGAMLTGPV